MCRRDRYRPRCASFQIFRPLQIRRGEITLLPIGAWTESQILPSGGMARCRGGLQRRAGAEWSKGLPISTAVLLARGELQVARVRSSRPHSRSTVVQRIVGRTVGSPLSSRRSIRLRDAGLGQGRVGIEAPSFSHVGMLGEEEWRIQSSLPISRMLLEINCAQRNRCGARKGC